MSNSQDPAPQDQQELHAATPGKSLRRLRKEADLTVEDVASATKISIHNIRAIEEESYEKLPADTFVRGLVTLYGDFLGLNGSKIAAEFLAERERADPASGRRTRLKKTIYSSSLTPKKLAEPSHISSATVALTLLVLIILSFTGFSLYTSWNPFAFFSRQTEEMQNSMQEIFNSNKEEETENESTPPPPHELMSSPEARDEIPKKSVAKIAQKSQYDTTANQQFPYILSALFLRDCGVVIKIDDRDPDRKNFKKGELARWNATDSLQIIFDKAQAATLTLNNTALAFPVPENNQLPTLLLPNDLLDQ